jgi:hypothetical protein
MAANVARGLVLNINSNMAVSNREMKKEARGTSKIALRDSVFLFSKTMRIILTLLLFYLLNARHGLKQIVRNNLGIVNLGIER